MTRNSIIILLTLTATLLCGGCKDETEAQRLTRAERDSLRRIDSAALKIGVLPTTDCLPLLVAEHMELFKAQGVTVHLKHYHALSECRYALEHGLVEGAVIDTVLMNELNGQEQWLYAGWRMPMKWHFLAAKKARLSRLSQMADKMIATDSHGLAHRTAEQANDTLRRKKQQAFIIQVEDLRVRTDMLINGNVDAALLPEPYATHALKAGATRVAHKEAASGNAGVIAFRTAGMEAAERKQQQAQFLKALETARDSIRRYGSERYNELTAW